MACARIRQHPKGSSYFCEPLEKRQLLSLTIPAHNSRPGAAQTLFLDFDGSPAFGWSNSTGGYVVRGPNSTIFAPTPVQAFSADGDFNNFSAAELTLIDHVYQWVAEKFSPFTINVTTVDPGFVSDSLTMTCLIAGSNSDWYTGSGGGTSSIGGFHDGGPNTCFVFSADAVNNGLQGGRLEQFIGESAAHEAGHEVGLVHQRTPGSEYYPGDIFRAPIMGGSSNNTQGRGIWWLTNNFAGQNSGDPVQNDLIALTQDSPDRLQFASDTGGGSLTFNTAGAVNPITGIINSTSDVDSFTFNATGASATFTVKNWQYGGMLAPTIKIRISGTQNYVPATTATANTNAALSTASLTVGGNYVLEIGSAGNYGDIGQYTVTGNQTQFAAYDAASRTVTVSGFAGNNNVTLFTNGVNTLTVQDSLNGGPVSSQTFTLSAVDSVSIDLGSGNDTLNWNGLFKADAVTDIPTYVAMGGGIDTLKLGGGSTFLTFNLGSIIIDATYAGIRISNIWNFDAEKVQLFGTSTTDSFNINSQDQYSSIEVFGGGGNDTLTMGPELFDENRPIVTFHGEGGTDTLVMADQTIAQDQSWFVWINNVTHHVDSTSSQGETDFDSTVENIVINGGAGADSFQAYEVAAAHTVTFNGNGGNDGFSAGYNDGHEINLGLSFSGAIQGSVSVVGGAGDDHLYVDDSDYYGIFNGYTIAGSYISNSSNSLYQNFVLFGADVEQLNFYAGNGGSRIVTVQVLPAAAALNVFGGSGVGDKLIIDDRTLQVVPFRVDIGTDYYKEYYGTQQSPTFRQLSQTQGFENFQLTTHNSTNAVNIFGLAATQFTSINTGINADTVTLYPHDANGDLTINGTLSFSGGGGSDKMIVDDTGQANPINYLFTNTFNIIDRIDGLGAGQLAPDSSVENITIKGGDGDDTFSFNQHKLSTGVGLYGGGGNDVLDFGGNDLAANIPQSISSFLFDGQDGSDTENFRNANNPDSWVYGITAASETISQSSLSSSYIIAITDANIEQKTVYAGPTGDSLQPFGLVDGQSLDFHGAGGDDAVSFFSNPKFIAGRINFYGEAGTNNRILEIGNADTVASVIHVTANTLGAFPGDTFFAPGGSMYFDSLGSISLVLGSGADIAYVAPNLTAAISISGGSPGASPGDTLNLALAGATSYVLHGTAASGNVTSSNLKTLTYSGFESGPNVDDVSPTVSAANINIDGTPPAAALRGRDAPLGGQSLDIQFSEDVALLLGTASIQLTNLTTAEPVPQGYLDMTYDPATQIAHFTFPGFPGGILPDGNYHGNVLSGAGDDLFGNALAADAPFDFFILSGDANHDRIVDISDLYALATSWQGSGKLFSDGDFNYDGTVDAADLGILSGKWQQTLAPPPAAQPIGLGRRPTRAATRVTRLVI